MRLHPVALMAACACCFGTGLFLGSSRPGFVSADQPPAREAPAKEAPAFAMPARLGANLYMQTAAEYRACCLQTYQTAEARLDALLQAARPRPAKPAVVMDLDETVLDNGAFESFLHRNQLEYTPALWDVYERGYPEEVGLVPGAGHFVRQAERRGVAVVFLSNRLEENRDATTRALRRLGVATDSLGDRLVLKMSREAGTDKSARREQVAARYNVLLYFGDSLRDFSETFAAPTLGKKDGDEAYRQAIQARLGQVDDARCHWGADWFILPNPSYGEWEKLFGDEPLHRLRPTKVQATGPARD
jgi:acid phosphatase